MDLWSRGTKNQTKTMSPFIRRGDIITMCPKQFLQYVYVYACDKIFLWEAPSYKGLINNK